MSLSCRSYKRSPLSQDESCRLAEACCTADEKLVVWTLLDTGLTVAEFCKLTEDQVNWMLHFLTVSGRRDKSRLVPMSKRVMPLVEHRIADNGCIGLSTRTVQRIVKRVAQRAGIMRATSPHILRHTFAVTSLRRGIMLPVLQKALGHERLATTEIYLNLSGTDVLSEYREKF